MLKLYKPTTPGRRKASVVSTKELFNVRPARKLRVIKKRKGGRSHGKIAVRHHGGEEKRYYRIIDFKRDKFDIPAIIKTLEYDPNRSAWIALVCYADGEKKYILMPEGIKVGDKILNSQKKIDPELGNRMLLKYIPLGTKVYNIELQPNQGGKLARSAGNAAVLIDVNEGLAQLKLPSSERRMVSENCLASIGSVSNPDWRFVRWGKAGRMRRRGIRPSVRGKAMAPVAHPHGGGEGNSPIGLKHPKTPWGKPALGVKTRNKKKWTNKYIVSRRLKKRKKK
ncbi:50S ribosomal protein L2 [Candidatus Parcubacteria bacterium 4484_255]|nr:MAG: 50S ribosomal protein L2 [Candidatus Parcubacteria bacterium 4484_255]